MRLLAEGRFGDPPIVAGESAVAGLAGFLIGSADPKLRRNLELGSDSRILVFGTEGATDPDLYARLVGRTPEQVAHIVEVK
jgi:diaminopropionate ammonia-lyase